MDTPSCEVCGEPATCFVRDFGEVHDSPDGFRRLVPDAGGFHKYCETHNRESHLLYVDEKWKREALAAIYSR